jgi:glycerol-3-phosphate acyltransferase PlsY
VKAELVKRALPRAIVHAAAGVAISAALYFLPETPVLIALALGTAVFIVIDLTRLRLPALGRRFLKWFAPCLRRAEDARVTGASYFLVGCLVSALAFQKEIAILAILFLSFGDPAATIFGIWKGRVRFWNKSFEGDAACLVSCLVISVLVVGISGRPALAVGFAGAFFAAIFEALPLPVNDNLTIPIGSGLAMMAVNALMG